MLRIGTRASELALTQARYVARLLGGQMVEAEIIEVSTSGDRGERLSDKARWTSELELALIAERVDLAVHSCKDVPTELAEGTELYFPAREDPRDVICGAPSLDALLSGARVGTASLRRRAQILAVRPDIEIVELRGNVDSRLRKLNDGEADAIILAHAGLRRLGREAEIGGFLGELVPAPGQGALALQVRAEDSEVMEAVKQLQDPASARCVSAEREVARGLHASCHTPLGALASAVDGDPDQVQVTAWVGLPDGSEWITHTGTGPWERAGLDLAATLLSAGAEGLLARAEEMLS